MVRGLSKGIEEKRMHRSLNANDVENSIFSFKLSSFVLRRVGWG